MPTVSDPRGARADFNAEPVIRLENVAVRYTLPKERIATFKEYAIRRIQGQVDHRSFWALRGVTFDVRRGEAMGIVGRNGAGKSTLLKVIARVLRPTEGRVWVRGAVAPLLDVGAGFHPELTGRENVFLNGTLLGFTRRQMQAKFDRIVDFAELWGFIDSPLRTYSSGMVVRLGFAVATDVEPDVLIVDEVLAVGDEAFQRKCEARMDGFRDHGAAILVVAHNAQRLRALCQRGIWLEEGTVKAEGQADDVIEQYHQASLS